MCKIFKFSLRKIKEKKERKYAKVYYIDHHTYKNAIKSETILSLREHLRTSSVQQGLIGCFRGLVVNGEILDIHSYMSVHLSEIIKDCKPFCQPNKCQNGARCVELWSNYECVCENKWAHFGDYCEKSKLLPIPISTTNSFINFK